MNAAAYKERASGRMRKAKEASGYDPFRAYVAVSSGVADPDDSRTSSSSGIYAKQSHPPWRIRLKVVEPFFFLLEPIRVEPGHQARCLSMINLSPKRQNLQARGIKPRA